MMHPPSSFFLLGVVVLLNCHCRLQYSSAFLVNPGTTARRIYATTNDDNWEHSFVGYVNYTSVTGDPTVPLSHPTLGKWVRMQRLHYKQYRAGRSSFTPDRLDKLQSANFVFDVKSYNWMKSYREYQDTSAPSSTIRRWSSTQRKLRREGSLSQERLSLLNDIDFSWDLHAEDVYRSKVSEIVRLNETKSVWDWKISDGPLGLWMSRQRTEFKKYCCNDKTHRLQSYQINLLQDSFGDCFNCRTFLNDTEAEIPRERVETSWEERMDQLMEYSRIHGHVNVPRTYTNRTNLGAWVSKVRERYRHYDETSPKYLQDRVEELEDLDFIWDVYEYKWQQRFRELIDYYEQYGDVHVPDAYGSLGTWVREQRREYHQFRKGDPSRLTPQHAIALNRMKLDWNRQTTTQRKQEETFRERLTEYREYCSNNTRTNNTNQPPPLSSLPKSLQYWVDNQRRLYRQWLRGEKTLPENRRKPLERSGIVQGIQNEL